MLCSEEEDALHTEEADTQRVTRADAEFDGSDQEWERLSEEQQFDLAVAALNRRRQGLLKFLEAEAARADELAVALSRLSLEQVLRLFPHDSLRCERWSSDVFHKCSECCNPAPFANGLPRQRWRQLSIQLTPCSLTLQQSVTCEHVSPMAVLLRAAEHQSHCCSCMSARKSIAETLEASFPGRLTQPIHRYEHISWQNSIMRAHAAPPPPCPESPRPNLLTCSQCPCAFLVWAKGLRATLRPQIHAPQKDTRPRCHRAREFSGCWMCGIYSMYDNPEHFRVFRHTP